MRSSHRFDDDVGWLYWTYGVRVWVGSLWLGGGFLIGCGVVIILIWILLREHVSDLNYTGWCQRHLTLETTC
jgi:hypothetical protein